jgi:hypothetical protein
MKKAILFSIFTTCLVTIANAGYRTTSVTTQNFDKQSDYYHYSGNTVDLYIEAEASIQHQSGADEYAIATVTYWGARYFNSPSSIATIVAARFVAGETLRARTKVGTWDFFTVVSTSEADGSLGSTSHAFTKVSW